MRKAVLLVALLLVLSAGCTRKQAGQFMEIHLSDPYVPKYSQFSADILVTNTFGHAIRDVEIYLVDDGMFEGQCEGYSDLLEPGETMLGTCYFRSGPIEGRDTIVMGAQFSSEYDVELPPVEFVSEQEYLRGVEKRQYSFSSSDGLVSLGARIDGGVPIRSGDEAVLFISVKNVGNGMLSSLPEGSITIYDPCGIVKKCYGFVKAGEVVRNTKTFRPVSGKLDEISCVLGRETDQILNSCELKFKMNYGYRIEGRAVMEVSG